MVGVDFSICNTFLLDINFEYCQLDFSSFYQLPIKKSRFINCSLKEVDFSETNLSEVSFDGSNLYLAKFEDSNLTKADFSSANNFTISPITNKIEGAKFLSDGLAGLLTEFNIQITD
jgi:uncharacterized protein YjbI with pentapeptide repeats